MLAYDLRIDGMTFKQIGETLGVCTERARSLFLRGEYRINWMKKHGMSRAAYVEMLLAS